MTPYNCFCTLMIIGVVSKAQKDLNNISAENGLSETLSPSSIIKDTPGPDYNIVTELNYGDYIIAHNGKLVINTMEARSVGAIALYPDQHKGWYAMSLYSGRILHVHKWEKQPVTPDVIYI